MLGILRKNRSDTHPTPLFRGESEGIHPQSPLVKGENEVTPLQSLFIEG